MYFKEIHKEFKFNIQKHSFNIIILNFQFYLYNFIIMYIINSIIKYEIIKNSLINLKVIITLIILLILKVDLFTITIYDIF